MLNCLMTLTFMCFCILSCRSDKEDRLYCEMIHVDIFGAADTALPGGRLLIGQEQLCDGITECQHGLDESVELCG